MQGMTIGSAAAAAGVGVETIRFYERRRLIDRPPRPERGFRIYSPDLVARVRFIREAQRLGFSLRQVGELLDLQADPAADAGEVRDRAAAKLEEVEHKITRLERIRAGLAALVAACPGSGPLGACSIIGALNGSETAFRPPVPVEE
jgi:MerR family mercuric resistance operon transcriptional regulator